MTLGILLFVAVGVQAFALISALGSGYVKGAAAVTTLLTSAFLITVTTLGAIALVSGGH